MKYCMAIVSLLLLAACAAPNPDKIQTVQHGSPCMHAGEIAHNASGGFVICKENGE